MLFKDLDPKAPEMARKLFSAPIHGPEVSSTACMPSSMIFIRACADPILESYHQLANVALKSEQDLMGVAFGRSSRYSRKLANGCFGGRGSGCTRSLWTI